MERRFFELRLEGERVLTGTAMRYGSTARMPWGDERFLPGSFVDVDSADVILNAHHDRATPLARTGGGGLEIRDTADALEIRAELPDVAAANDVLVLVRRKVLRGLSVEFAAVNERMEGRVRVISRAYLRGVGVVDRPAYPDSVVEAMRSKFAGEEVARTRRRYWL